MFRRLRTWLLGLRDAELAYLRDELSAAGQRDLAYKQRLDELSESLKSVREVRTRLLRLIDAILTGIELPVQSLTEEWKTSPSTAKAAVSNHLDQLRAADRKRASDAETELTALKREKAEAEQRADVAEKKAAAIDVQNKLLALIHEGDIAMRRAELAARSLQRAEAEAATAQLAKPDEE